MLIKNVLMDANEGLYIDLSDIKKRLDDIEEKIPEEITKFKYILVSPSSVGYTAKFKAWRSCQYTESTTKVKSKTVDYKPNAYPIYEYNVFQREWGTGLIATELPNTDDDLSKLQSGFTCVESSDNGYTTGTEKVAVDQQDCYLSSSGITTTCPYDGWHDTLPKETETDVDIYTRTMTNDIVFYTLEEPDMCYLSADDFTKEEYGLVTETSHFTLSDENAYLLQPSMSITWRFLNAISLNAIPKKNVFKNATYVTTTVPEVTGKVYNGALVLSLHLAKYNSNYYYDNLGAYTDWTLSKYYTTEDGKESFTVVSNTQDAFRSWPLTAVDVSTDVKAVWSAAVAGDQQGLTVDMTFVDPYNCGQTAQVSSTSSSSAVRVLASGKPIGFVGITAGDKGVTTGYDAPKINMNTQYTKEKLTSDTVEYFVLKDTTDMYCNYLECLQNNWYTKDIYSESETAMIGVFLKTSTGMRLVCNTYEETTDDGTLVRVFSPAQTVTHSGINFTRTSPAPQWNTTGSTYREGSFVRAPELDVTATFEGLYLTGNSGVDATTVTGTYDKSDYKEHYASSAADINTKVNALDLS